MQDDCIRIPLTQGKIAVIDATDLELVSPFSWHAQPSGKTWYANSLPYVRGSGRKGRRSTFLTMHRLIMDAPKGIEVDHIDGDGLNNRRSNLRLVSRQENSFNQRRAKNNKSGFKGVTWTNGLHGNPTGRQRPWQANIRVNNQLKFLGRFATVEEAAHAYDEAARQYFGDFARLNFP